MRGQCPVGAQQESSSSLQSWMVQKGGRSWRRDKLCRNDSKGGKQTQSVLVSDGSHLLTAENQYVLASSLEGAVL